jgi:hypothetical protein
MELVRRVPEQVDDERREERNHDQQDHDDAAGHRYPVPS